ncbi:MAG: DUF4412 domain-containing protein [bacterium]|nr:DUF4412 domain-containing protein [bacterium]
MKRLFTFLAALVLGSFLMAQNFNGVIEFRYTNQNDTTLNTYSVKGKKVRLDQYNKKTKTVEGSFLFDLDGAEVKFLNPKRKIWGSQKSETPQVIRGQCVVSKGNGIKTIAGIKCNEYVVKNSAENTVITYWISDSKYDFFPALVKLWNRKDKQSVYFSQIKIVGQGAMPMLSEEKQLTDGKLLTRLEVIKISTVVPDASTFEIPAGYSKLDQ